MKKGFTLAEVLITLGIIGIVAALTMPALIAREEKIRTISQLKKTYTTLNQSIMRAQLDYGEYEHWETNADLETNSYFRKYWKPYYNDARLCATGKECGYKSNAPWQNLVGNTIGWSLQSSETRILFRLMDGTIIFLPRNTTDINGNPQYVSYFYIDINGKANPNILGKDVFMFTVISGKAVMPYCYNYTEANIDANCTKNTGNNGNCCTAKIIKDGWQIKEDYPW